MYAFDLVLISYRAEGCVWILQPGLSDCESSERRSTPETVFYPAHNVCPPVVRSHGERWRLSERYSKAAIVRDFSLPSTIKVSSHQLIFEMLILSALSYFEIFIHNCALFFRPLTLQSVKCLFYTLQLNKILSI